MIKGTLININNFGICVIASKVIIALVNIGTAYFKP